MVGGQVLTAGPLGSLSERWLGLKGGPRTSCLGPSTLGDSLTVGAGPARRCCVPTEVVAGEQV